IDPLDLRRKNALQLGGELPTGQRLVSSVSAREVLDVVAARSDYARKRKEYPDASGIKKRGIGISLAFHGAGFTGSGEVKLKPRAGVELTEHGARVLSVSTDIGQGAITVFSQMAADALGLPLDDVEVAENDTSKVPDSGPTVASRTTMVVGGTITKAALAMARILQSYVAEVHDVPAEEGVDVDTNEVSRLDVSTATDVGRAIHPVLAEGQVEGGTVQALGYALLEEHVWSKGRLLNTRMQNYVIPTALDVPRLHTTLLENPYPQGPYGAKGLGELPMDGPAPAVVGAVLHAIGKLIPDLPLSPDRIMRAVQP